MPLERERNLCYILCGMLILAVFEMPYGYYTFLRICVCFGAGYFAYKMFSNDVQGKKPYLMAGIAVLFNPVIPIYLEREFWFFIDLACTVLFFMIARSNKEKSLPISENASIIKDDEPTSDSSK